MRSSKSKIAEIAFYCLLIALVCLLFYRFTRQNFSRIQEQNQVYASDAAVQIADRIADQFKSSEELLGAYAFFLEREKSVEDISPALLERIERKSPFDSLTFTTRSGVNIGPDGREINASDREYHLRGMQGDSGAAALLPSRRVNRHFLGFYTPLLNSAGEIAGVLMGGYISDSFLRSLLETSYFGKPSDVYLCLEDGRIIASSSGETFSGTIYDILKKEGAEQGALDKMAEMFSGGREGVYACDAGGRAGDLCAVSLRKYGCMLVQTFPRAITRAMVDNANMAGVQLEIGLLALFAVYALWLVMRARRQKKKLEKENSEFALLFRGLDSLFASRYCLVDLDAGSYRFIVSPSGENDLPREGEFAAFLDREASLIKDETEREEFAAFFKPSHLRSLFAKNDIAGYECQVMRDGKPEWENITAVCILRKDGRPSQLLFLRQNVTETKQRELQTRRKISALDRKERQYRLAVTTNALCDFEFNVSRDLIEQDVLQKTADGPASRLSLVGLTPPCRASELFEAWGSLVSPESREDFARIMNPAYFLEQYARGNYVIDLDYWRMDRDGRETCVRQSVYLSRDELSQDIMAMAVSRDITEQIARQRAQTRALQDALDLARHANEAKSIFLSSMSHDIRTPMNAIIGFATIAANHLDNRSQVEDCLRKVLSSSNHLLSLINDILDMSRIESGKLQVKEQECNISELMHNLVAIIQPQVKAKQMHLFIDAFDVTDEDVLTDPLKLNQVFINLLSNAVKYTPAGGDIILRLSQKPSSREGCADYVFEVEDNGMGMDEEFVTHIFEPFTRAATTTQNGIQGTGLGMAITKNIVDILKGSIEVESRLGAGSKFTVTFTLKLLEREGSQGGLAEFSGLRALVADDDFHVCQSVCQMLQKFGLETEWTMSGDEARRRAQLAAEQGKPFDVFIIDWRMPDMNGVETSRQIRRAAGDDAPIIILTAYEWTDIEEEAREAGVTGFCAKPLFMSDLKNALFASRDSGPPAPEEAWSAPKFAENARILVVEDLDLNREIAEFMLTESGFEVETAPDGTDAVEMVRASPEKYYDAILMDVQMPTMNGYEATRAIRNLDRRDVGDMPIIAMTANALEEDKAEALKCGMNDHIAKPIDIRKFFEVLRKFFR